LLGLLRGPFRILPGSFFLRFLQEGCFEILYLPL